MGVSFKVAKAGKRYRPMVVQTEDKENDSGGGGVVDDNRNRPEEQVWILCIYVCIALSF